MQFEKMPAIMFYDKDNVLVGSVGIPGDTTEPGVEKMVKAALMDVFSVEKAERIVYFKVEDHWLIIK